MISIFMSFPVNLTTRSKKVPAGAFYDFIFWIIQYNIIYNKGYSSVRCFASSGLVIMCLPTLFEVLIPFP